MVPSLALRQNRYAQKHNSFVVGKKSKLLRRCFALLKRIAEGEAWKQYISLAPRSQEGGAIAERGTGMGPLNTLQIRLSWRSGGTFPGPVDGLNVLPRGHTEGSFEQCAESCRILVSKIGCCLGYGCPCSQLWKRRKKARLLSPCHKAESCFPAKQPSERTTR